MTYASKETSVESSRPVEVYDFLVGATPYRFTSTEGLITIGVNEYEPIRISRNNLEDDLERRDVTFEATLPADNPLPQLFRNVPPGGSTLLTVRRFHATDTPSPEVQTIFDGEVQSIQWRKDLSEALITALPAIAAKTHGCPRFTYQGPCNHVLYDPLTCKADPSDPAFRASSYSVSAQVGRILTVPDLSTDFAAGWFTGGFVEVVGGFDFRMVLAQSGDDLELLLPLSPQPLLVNVFAGCAHDTSVNGCPKFNQGDNYGGFAFTPKKNIFETGLS